MFLFFIYFIPNIHTYIYKRAHTHSCKAGDRGSGMVTYLEGDFLLRTIMGERMEEREEVEDWTMVDGWIQGTELECPASRGATSLDVRTCPRAKNLKKKHTQCVLSLLFFMNPTYVCKRKYSLT